jgi:hypothetical protein
MIRRIHNSSIPDDLIEALLGTGAALFSNASMIRIGEIVDWPEPESRGYNPSLRSIV